MDSLGLFPPSIANLAGITLDLTRVYSLSSSSSGTVSKTVDAGLYFIIVMGNDGDAGSNGSIVLRSNDNTLMYCASYRCYFQFTNTTTISAHTNGISTSLTLSAIWINES
jgi:hypothetical protein